MSGAVRVGVIGVGAISASYLENMTRFPDLEVVRVGDLDLDRARSRAEEFGIPRWGSADDVLADAEVEIVVNLTIPAVHAEVSARALDAGKHVWSEKPVGVTRAEADALVRQADAAGLRLGVAPDTLLGPGMQTVRRLISRGDIGEPLSAVTMLHSPGPQRGHPNPEFLFQRGAGPLFDFGPYYFTALVNIFGPFERVAAVGARSSATRVVGSGPLAGREFDVAVPTNVSVVSEFTGGAVAQSTLSWDADLQRMGVFEIFGTEGTLAITDPNTFSGRIKVAHAPAPGPFDPNYQVEWTDVEESGITTGRGLGVLEMARAIRADRPHIATGRLGAHVLDALVAVEESMDSHAFVDVRSSVDEVPLLADDFDPFLATFSGVAS